MTTKPLQLTGAILAGVLLGVFTAHYFLRSGDQRSAVGNQKSVVSEQRSEDSPPSLQNSNTPPPASPPVLGSRSASALSPQVSALNPSATLSISSFTETRSQITSPSASIPQSSGLRLELLFSGEVVNRSLKYGNLQITKAVDNAGNDLIIQRAERPGGFVTNSLPVLRPIEAPKPQSGTPISQAGTPVLPFPLLRPSGTKTDSALHRSAATPADASGNARATNPAESAPSAPSVVKQNSAADPKTQNPKPSATPQSVRLLIHLKTPPRTSTALKELEGTLQFLQTSGTLEIKTPAIKTLEGKAIETAELQAARVSIGVQPARKSSFVTDPARAVTLRVGGLKDAVLRVVFVDKDNKPLRTTNSWYSPSPGVEDWTYVFEKPVTEEITLVLKPAL